jgi:glycosyltransferase involved in cell wall biosynthesis
MHIVINSIYPQGYYSDNASFTEELFVYLTEKYPEHHFYFLINKGSNHHCPTAANATIIPINTAVTNIASLKIWGNIRLPLLLKKLKATVLVQPYGFCSLTTNTPQVLMVSDLLWIDKTQYLPRTIRLYHRLFGKQSIKKASRIITFSEIIKQGLIDKYPIAAENISAINGAAAAIYQPITHEQKQQAKDGYADGREYFLFTGGNNPKNNLVGLLKAFSLFKKWQKSNMKLLIAGPITPQKGDVLDKLDSYKYKDDVVILKGINERQLALVTASAYAFIFPTLVNGFAVPLLSAMQCGVPAIATDLNTNREVGAEGILYALPNDVDGMANQMKLLYRDELMKASLIEKGFQQAAVYNWERTVGLFWDVVLKVVSASDNKKSNL